MILVTGGTGLVGSHLLLELLKTESKIKAIHREDSNLAGVKKVFSFYIPSEKADELFNRIEWLQADLHDIPALSIAFEGVTVVYHCAALVSFDSARAEALRKINIEGTANIVNLCISFGIEKLCYISSVATLDAAVGEKEIRENFTWYPEKDHSDYAISKHGAEIEVWRGSQEGVPVVILNPGVILGPGFWNKGTGQIFKKIDEGLKYHFPKTTGFAGVKDVVKAAVLAMETGENNSQYILVSENLSFKTVLDEVAEHLEKAPPRKELKPWMVFTGWLFQTVGQIFGGKKMISKNDYKSLFEHTYYSNRKVREELGFQFTPMREVIKEVSEIYKSDKSGTY